MMPDMEGSDEFYEDGEPVAEVLAAFEQGVKSVTKEPVRGWTLHLDVPGQREFAGFLDPSPNRSLGEPELVKHP